MNSIFILVDTLDQPSQKITKYFLFLTSDSRGLKKEIGFSRRQKLGN